MRVEGGTRRPFRLYFTHNVSSTHTRKASTHVTAYIAQLCHVHEDREAADLRGQIQTALVSPRALEHAKLLRPGAPFFCRKEGVPFDDNDFRSALRAAAIQSYNERAVKCPELLSYCSDANLYVLPMLLAGGVWQ